MSRAKRKAKEADAKPKEEPFAWRPGEGGLLKGTQFAKPPCPKGSQKYHQYVKRDDLSTRGCEVWECRLCNRRLGVNRKSGNVRERAA